MLLHCMPYMYDNFSRGQEQRGRVWRGMAVLAASPAPRSSGGGVCLECFTEGDNVKLLKLFAVQMTGDGRG